MKLNRKFAFDRCDFQPGVEYCIAILPRNLLCWQGCLSHLFLFFLWKILDTVISGKWWFSKLLKLSRAQNQPIWIYLFLYGHNVVKCIPPTACGLSKLRITGLIALVATTLFFPTWITCFGHVSFFSSINWLQFFQLIELCFCAITFNICHFFLIVDHSVVVFTFSNSNDFELFYILWLICTNPCLWFSDLVKICYLSLMHHPSEQKLQLLNLMWLWLLQDHTWS